MFEHLIDLYRAYKKVREAKPYKADVVQAYGMAFAEEWKKQRENIIEAFKLAEDEFDYSLHHTLMPQIVKQYA